MWHHKAPSGCRVVRLAIRASRSQDKAHQKMKRNIAKDVVPEDGRETWCAAGSVLLYTYHFSNISVNILQLTGRGIHPTQLTIYSPNFITVLFLEKSTTTLNPFSDEQRTSPYLKRTFRATKSKILLRVPQRQISVYKHFSGARKVYINTSPAPERCF